MALLSSDLYWYRFGSNDFVAVFSQPLILIASLTTNVFLYPVSILALVLAFKSQNRVSNAF